MNNFRLIFVQLFVLFSLLASAQDDKNESPYFHVNGESGKVKFPLLSTDVEAKINGPIADVTLTQEYKNKGEQPIEAMYVFPSSTRSAVYDMEMHIGDRVIKAEVQEKQKARITYEKAKEEGKRASLLEQHKPNVFQMNVANIMPGEVVKVVMKYTEFIIPEDQQYSFHFPTVVGPRYTGESPAAFAAQPYSKAGKKPQYTFDINVIVETSVPIAAIRCPSHKTVSNVLGRGLKVELDDDGYGGNKDFILKYSLSGNTIEAGVQTYKVNGEQFFLCQVEPPALEAKPTIAPREYIFIMDVSGSMNGYPLDVSKQLMKRLFSNLRPTDKFNIMFFAGSAFALSPQSLDATKENVSNALSTVNGRNGGGGTNMLGAIKTAMASPKEDGFSRSFVIITDGYVSVEEKAFDYVHQHLDKANFFAFGIGNSVNRHLIEGLAHVGRARPFIVTNQSDAQHEAERLRKYIQYPVLTDISITGSGVELYDMAPDHIPDLMAGRPIYFFGKYKGDQNGMLEIKGENGATPFFERLELVSPSDDNKSLAQLWARETIKNLDDYNSLKSDQKRINKVTELGLKYNLLTKYTSFVAVDHEVVNEGGVPKAVKQLLPMVEKISNLAIGFEMKIEDLAMESSDKKAVLDITVVTKNMETKEVAELLLEAIINEKLESFDTTDRTIKIKTNTSGELVSEIAEIDVKLVDLLIMSLRKFGLSIEDLEFDIQIEKK